MGRLGYQSDAQSSLAVSYNNLESYAASLHEALTRPYPQYEAIGVRAGDDYRQLGTSMLQIENEFYGTIRPKRVIRPGERPLHALRERGVEYVEVRLMDLDPFEAVGINAGNVPDARRLPAALPAASTSPPDTPEELSAIIRNKQRVAARGREPGLRLICGADDVPLGEWGARVLAECEPIAAALDAATGTHAHRDAVEAAHGRLADPASTPSARVLQAMEREHGNSYVRFVLAQSRRHRDAICGLPLAKDTVERFARLAEESRTRQHAIEAADTVPFEVYRQKYLDPARLTV